MADFKRVYYDTTIIITRLINFSIRVNRGFPNIFKGAYCTNAMLGTIKGKNKWWDITLETPIMGEAGSFQTQEQVQNSIASAHATIVGATNQRLVFTDVDNNSFLRWDECQLKKIDRSITADMGVGLQVITYNFIATDDPNFTSAVYPGGA